MAMSVELVLFLVFAGLVVGFASALFGVGGGILMVPLIVLIFGRSQHLAQGTSLLVIVPTAVAGVLAHRKSQFVSFRYSVLIALGGVGGAYVGAAVALELPQERLQLLFGLFMAVTGARLLRTGWKIRGSSGSSPPDDPLDRLDRSRMD